MKTFKMTLVEYHNSPMFREWDKDHKYPCYNVATRYELPPMKFRDLLDAEEWLLGNFLDYCIGYSIAEVDDRWHEPVKGGDFCIDASIDEYVYYHGRDLKEVYRKCRENRLRAIAKERDERDEDEDLLEGIPEEELKAVVDSLWRDELKSIIDSL